MLALLSDFIERESLSVRYNPLNDAEIKAARRWRPTGSCALRRGMTFALRL